MASEGEYIDGYKRVFYCIDHTIFSIQSSRPIPRKITFKLFHIPYPGGGMFSQLINDFFNFPQD